MKFNVWLPAAYRAKPWANSVKLGHGCAKPGAGGTGLAPVKENEDFRGFP